MNDTVTAACKGRLVRINNERYSIILETKIDDSTSGLQPEYSRLLHTTSEDNVLTIGNYIQALRVEINPSDHYRRDIIRLLCTLSRYNKNHSFKDMNRDDIISFLDSYRKPEISDPMHRWIGTYNLFRMLLLGFLNGYIIQILNRRNDPNQK